MGKVVGLCGFKNTGKNTIADILVKNHNFKHLSFAEKLKDTISVLFDLPRDMVEGATVESRMWRDEPLPFWTRELGYDVTPRKLLQLIGTDALRNSFHPDIWLLIVKSQILADPESNFAISDTRFPNEIDFVRDMGGEIWQVRRGDLPAWWNQLIDSKDEKINNLMMEAYRIHESEWKWIGPDDQFDHIIENNATIEDLEQFVAEAENGNVKTSR